MADLSRFDSAQLFSIFKADGDNLLDFDGLAGILDGEDELLMMLPEEGEDASGVHHELAVDGGVLSPTADLVLPALLDIKSEQGDTSNASGVQDWTIQRTSGNPTGSSDGHVESSLGVQHAKPTTTGRNAGRGGRAAARATTPAAGLTSDGEGDNGNGNKKRRTRNDEQMEMNRVAQQKYRERKKAEQQGLAQAVEMLTVQLAALKAVEVRANELEAANQALSSTVAQQAGTISSLSAQAAASAAAVQTVQGELAASQAIVASQQKMILDQHQKLALQEQIIASLKDRLKDRIDDAMKHVVPGTVCEKMVMAVKTTLYDAKDQGELQDVLGQLPEHLVQEICKNIFQVCHDAWPELKVKCGALACAPTVAPCPYS